MRHRNRALAAAVPAILGIALVAMTLGGCTANPVAAKVVPSTRAATTQTRSAAPVPSASATVSPLAISAAKASPVAIGCSALVPDAAIAAFGAQFRTAADYTPPAGSAAAEMLAANGTACEWKDAASSSTLQVAVAHPGASDLLRLKNTLVDQSNSVPTYGEEAYFQLGGGVGEVDAFHGKYWIVAVSPDFYEPGDASGIISAVGDAIDAQ